MNDEMDGAEQLAKHLANIRGKMSAQRRDDKVSACGWQLSVHGLYNVAHNDEHGRSLEGRFVERG